MDKLTEIYNVRVKYETEKAIMVEYERAVVWLPLSLIEVLTQAEWGRGDMIQVEVPLWLAEGKGWI